MADFQSKVTLGRSGLKVSRLGLGSSYGAPASAYEEAFERGVNYFYWGTWRRNAMHAALVEITRRRRDDVIVVVQSYARPAMLVRLSLEMSLRRLKLDHADVLLLGWHNHAPSEAIFETCLELKRRGRIRHVALSSHHRRLFPTLLDEERIAIWHVRYNAVHRGAEREVFPAVSQSPPLKRPGVVTFTTTRWGHLCDPRRTPAGERTPTGTDCYRFALSHPTVDVALAGPSNIDQMRQALHALELGPMSDDELAWMRRVGDHIYGRDRTTAVRDSL